MSDQQATRDRAVESMRLVRAERTGDVHVVTGPTVASRGRELSGTLCDLIVSGHPFFGASDDLTCRECRAEYIPGEDWSGR